MVGRDIPHLPVKSLLLDYIRTAQKRPGMYFGSEHVDDVRRHLDGWRAHRIFSKDDDAFAEAFFDGFHRFVERHYGDDRTIGWNGLIRENTSSDREGFETFIELIAAFAAEYAAGTDEG